MGFTPKTLADLPVEEWPQHHLVAIRVIHKPTRQHTVIGYRAEWAICGCGRETPTFTMVDVRHIPGIDGAFICDSCWTHLQRHKVPLHSDHQPASRKDWDLEWFRLHGAPQEILDSVAGQRRKG